MFNQDDGVDDFQFLLLKDRVQELEKDVSWLKAEIKKLKKGGK